MRSRFTPFPRNKHASLSNLFSPSTPTAHVSVGGLSRPSTTPYLGFCTAAPLSTELNKTKKAAPRTQRSRPQVVAFHLNIGDVHTFHLSHGLFADAIVVTFFMEATRRAETEVFFNYD